jgi:hypothetical protein
VADVHGPTFAAMSIMWIANPLKPDCGVQIWLVVSCAERQVIKAMLLDVMNYEAAFFLARPHATLSLRVYGVRLACVSTGLLTEREIRCDQNAS